MKKVKTLLLILAVMIFSSIITPLYAAYADSPPPPGCFYSFVTNTASNVKYTDILIKISKDSKYYTDLNISNASAYGFNSLTPIAAYNQDGYVSISFHCKNLRLHPETFQQKLGLCRMVYFDNADKPISAIANSIKIALLDKDGNILKVSDAVSVIPTADNTFARHVEYDAGGTTPKVEFQKYYGKNSGDTVYLSGFILLAFFIRMAISTSIETLIAVPYKIRPLWKIVVVNIITQTLLFALIAIGGTGYANAVIIGEIFVFISEYMAYIFLFRNISKGKLALYTVIANTASLTVGLIFNSLYIFV